jgi:hypothetical protein
LTSPELDAFEALSNNRYVILGGGVAPHRRRPELFAWVLTRFVEEKIAGSAGRYEQPMLSKRGGQQEIPIGDDDSPNPSAVPEPRPLNRLARLQEFLSPGSFLVTGRVIATMIFYWAIMKVGIHQFDNICAGMVNVQSAVKHVQNWRATTFRFVGKLFSRLGGLFLITSYTSSTKATSTAAPPLAEGSDDGAGRSESGGASSGPSKADSTMITPEDDGKPDGEPSASTDAPSPSQPTTGGSEDSSADESEGPSPQPEQEKEKRKPLFFLDHVVA